MLGLTFRRIQPISVREMLILFGVWIYLQFADGLLMENGTWVTCGAPPEMAARHTTGTIVGGINTLHQVERQPCEELTYEQLRFRTYDGTCNHPEDKGSAFGPVKRLMVPMYQDSLNAPRDRTKRGKAMPSARAVSLAVHRPKATNTSFTLLLMQFGQYLDHDISLVPVATEADDTIRCCGVPKSKQYIDCYPITVPKNDKHFNNCMEFVRSEPDILPNGTLNIPRNHRNAITAWLDSSSLYGSDRERAKELRTRNGTGALLLTTRYKGQERLPEGPKDDCIVLKDSHYCVESGDDRVTEQPGLASMHTVFHLEHNRLVKKLATVLLYRQGRPFSPGHVEHFLHTAPDKVQERMFQVVRKVMGAVWQYIVYEEYLPLIVGPVLMTKYGLWTGQRVKLQHNVDPGVAQEFLSCAFRFGHTLVNDLMIIKDKEVLKNLFSTSEHYLEDYTNIVKGLVSMKNHAEKFDSHIASSLQNDLFRNSKTGMAFDLPALNIQRGRDHAIPRYNELRKRFGLKPYVSWEEFGSVWKDMKRIYRDIDDVECFPGGTAEFPVWGGVVGPTFAHIIAQQFHDLKYGDRYFFETDDLHYGFSTAELRALSRIYFSKILCENADIPFIQQNPFRFPDRRSNPVYKCESYPDIEMWYWTRYFF
ncbi:chorion peroxidase-like [Babylonia areolata]|uniref:chorion peroxidase-like n=1 Tax=Babylonia areolata TaxID=304850 RepID=UPI003FD45F6A